MSLPVPATAPAVMLAPERRQLLEQISEGLDANSLTWLSGYFAGLAAGRGPAAAGAAALAGAERHDPTARATILYASQTGNGRRIAEKLARNLESSGIAVRAVSTADYAVRELAQERLLFLIASTHGDGDAPDDARAFNDFLFSRRAGRLERLAYSVLALGDSSYPQFCAVGRRFDAQLATLGARRLAPVTDCDVDYEATAAGWMQAAAESAQSELQQAPRLAVVTALRTPALTATREQPFEAEVLVAQRITGRGSDKLVTHLEIAAPSQRLAYEPGDAVGIWQRNPPETVERVIELLALAADTPVSVAGHQRSLRDWLLGEREITRLTRPFIEAHAQRSGSAALQSLLAPEQSAALREVLKTWQLPDLLKRHPAQWSADALVGALRPLTPRLYSIASSREAVGDELHLTVAAVDYQFDGEQRYGSASRYLTTIDQARLASAEQALTVRAYVEANARFRLPTDAQRDIIMIGPGTGVAPFRGFLQQRSADGARGRNWLIYGGRQREMDFLYQTEWLEALKRRRLARLDVAFSRDQAAKVYVQNRIREQGKELFAWLEGGASVYVCGDAERMAPDVHAALIEVIATHGGRSVEDAAEYLNELAQVKRYARDVY